MFIICFVDLVVVGLVVVPTAVRDELRVGEAGSRVDRDDDECE
jgi:hypothetical protein